MRFLFRLAFWLGLILVLLPGGNSPPAATSDVSPSDAISAARATVADMRKFCDRQPDACTFGAQAAVAIGHRAQAGAKLLYEFLNEQLGPVDGSVSTAATSGSGITGAVTKPDAAVPLPLRRPSQDTLTPEDRLSAWRGPQPRST
jgi:hypothetical protein